jgi:hypothetical protein
MDKDEVFEIALVEVFLHHALNIGTGSECGSSMRLIKNAAGATIGKTEFIRMAQEKADAATAAETAGALAFAKGKRVAAATKPATAPIRRRVGVNRKRLFRG